MAALTYPAVTSPSVTRRDSSNGDANDPLFMAYVLLNTLSLILSFVVVILSVVLLAEVDLVVTDEDLRTFIHRHQYLFLGLTGVFGTSILTIVASIIVAGFFNYNRATAIASATICVSAVVFVAVMAAWVAPWTRSRLEFHISEAGQRMRDAVKKLLQGAAAPASAPSTGGAAASDKVAAAAAAGWDDKDSGLRLQPAL